MFRSTRWTALAIVALSFSALWWTGCRPAARPAAPAAAATTGGPTPSQITEIEDQLKSALFQVQPENLGIDSRVDDAVSVLNNWWAAVKAARLEPTGLTPPEIPAERLPAEERTRLSREAFDVRDGLHMRESYLAQAIANPIADRNEGDLARAVALFEYVCRNIVLLAEDDPRPPFTVYELLLTGRGRPADRAWIYGTLLRQLRLDAVVLQARQEESSEQAPWLIGVPIESQVYLFDARLGTAIPRGSDPPAVRVTRPATLQEVLEHPDWLKALAARSDQPYEPTAEQLQTSRAQLIASPASWAPRMWNVEQLLPGDRLCVLYDPPAALGDAPGLFARAAAASGVWKAEDLSLWAYPQQALHQHLNMNANELRLVQAALTPFVVPVEFRADENKQPRRVETLRQLKIRTTQLKGDYANAVGQYISIRHLAVMTPPDQALIPIYARAADDAYFWSCVCKVEAGEYESAAESLADYLKRFSRKGRWGVAARQLLAESQLALGQVAEAVQTLKMSLPDDTYRDGNAVLLKRLAELAAKPATEKSAE